MDGLAWLSKVAGMAKARIASRARIVRIKCLSTDHPSNTRLRSTNPSCEDRKVSDSIAETAIYSSHVRQRSLSNRDRAKFRF